MLSFIYLALLLPLHVWSRPLTLVIGLSQLDEQSTHTSCVIANVNYPNPRETLLLLDRRAVSPPPGLPKRTFADLLILCHERKRSTRGILLARQNPSCPAGAASGSGGGNGQGAAGPMSLAGGGSGTGSSDPALLNDGPNDATASSIANNGATSPSSSGSGTTSSSGSGASASATTLAPTATTSATTMASATSTSFATTTTTTSATSTTSVSNPCPSGQTAAVAATLALGALATGVICVSI